MSKLDTQISPGAFERNQPSGAKRMDNKLVPTFLQKTYALVNVRPGMTPLEPRVPGHCDLGRRTIHLCDLRSESVCARGAAKTLQTKQDVVLRAAGSGWT